MEQGFWLERWRHNEIGFHRDTCNPHLPASWPRVGAPPGAEVLVPLCGKSLDMLWLRARGYRVLGVEVSPLAVEAFFRENGLAPEISETGPFHRYSVDHLTLLCGDFFQLTPHHLPKVGALYDRAALIALPADLRRRYTARLAVLLPAHAPGLLVTMEYPPGEMEGPPFSISETEVRELLAPDFGIEHLYRQNLLDANGEEAAHWRARGLTQLAESVYRLKHRSTPPAGTTQAPPL